jgi:hypothetical protein
MCAPPLDHGELIHHGHVCLSSMHHEPRRNAFARWRLRLSMGSRLDAIGSRIGSRKLATFAASFDERLANDTLGLSRSEQHAHHRRHDDVDLESESLFAISVHGIIHWTDQDQRPICGLRLGH